MWNIVYADRGGNTFTVCNGVFPRRDPKYDWRHPVPGWEEDAQWKGIIPFGELPQFANPASGVIVQCNNSVYSSSRPPPLDPAKFPRYVAGSALSFPPDTRAARAFELLDAGPKASWENLRRAALDVPRDVGGPARPAAPGGARGSG